MIKNDGSPTYRRRQPGSHRVEVINDAVRRGTVLWDGDRTIFERIRDTGEYVHFISVLYLRSAVNVWLLM